MLRRYTILLFLTSLSLGLSAQYFLKSKIVLPILELNDGLLFTQLDSILFKKYPCRQAVFEKEYIYFTQIEGDSLNNYKIDIIYAKPSEIENSVNTGIYKMNNAIFVIREKSKIPLFELTNNIYIFSYTKILTKEDENMLKKMLVPEEFCVTKLFYHEKLLKLIGFK